MTQEGWALVGTLGDVLMWMVHYSVFQEVRAAACLLTWGMGSLPPVLFHLSTSVLCLDPPPPCCPMDLLPRGCSCPCWLRPFRGAQRCPTAGGAVCGQWAECHLIPILNSELQIIQHF